MKCLKLTCFDYRNIENALFEPCSGVTVLCGNNGEGKTNALESIYLFAQGKSFRTAHDRELIRFGCDSSYVKLEFQDSNKVHTLEMRFLSDGKKSCRRNGIETRRMSEFIGYFRAVLFCPQHLSIVREGPSLRRGFLDVAISQLKPLYLASLQRYNNILCQRNALIKNYKNDRSSFDSTIGIWSEQLAKEAAAISEERANYTKRLDVHVKKIVSDMTSGREEASVAYDKPRSADEYLSQLTLNLEREIYMGSTLYGSHKDDLRITLNEREARNFASQGQQRSIALAMKLAEGEISKEISGEYPVFLFDDILSELDGERREFILGGLENRQVIMTVCEPFIKAEKIYKVRKGWLYVPSSGQ